VLTHPEATFCASSQDLVQRPPVKMNIHSRRSSESILEIFGHPLNRTFRQPKRCLITPKTCSTRVRIAAFLRFLLCFSSDKGHFLAAGRSTKFRACRARLRILLPHIRLVPVAPLFSRHDAINLCPKLGPSAWPAINVTSHRSKRRRPPLGQDLQLRYLVYSFHLPLSITDHMYNTQE